MKVMNDLHVYTSRENLNLVPETRIIQKSLFSSYMYICNFFMLPFFFAES